MSTLLRLCLVLSWRVRDTGKTLPMEGPSDENLSMDVLVEDLVALVQTMFKDVEAAPVIMVIFY